MNPGVVVLFGSGEISANGRKVYDWLFSRLPAPIRVAVLETPAGFQPNSAFVAGQVADFLCERLQNYHPEVAVVPARKRGTPFSPDDPAILAPVLTAGVIFLGPGSPTYAAKQLHGSLAWDYLIARHRLGAAIVMASAATVAASEHTLPVYEIYKAGEDLHWRAGLDFFGPYGQRLAIIPHWNNTEGGAKLDTSRCYMGRERFERLVSMLPPAVLVLGIDEHTALVVDIGAETCSVMGRGGVTLLKGGQETCFNHGQEFPISRLGPFHLPGPPAGGREQVSAPLLEVPQIGAIPPSEVLSMVAEREATRSRQDWKAADVLREEIAALGWQVSDTPEGPVLSLLQLQARSKLCRPPR